ncbi:MAG TPA: MATE family efflux transporter, partial [Planctomycetota bacterium]|nr:MATE family efflux transporter [Planctomycetota bacterium]
MIAPEGAAARAAKSKIGVRSVVRLAWPAVLSYLLANAYRINDQYWIQGLGPDAQAAVGGTVFVVIMNFSLVFLAAGGTLALVARATGAGDSKRRDGLIASALALAGAVWLILACIGFFATSHIVAFLGLRDAAAVFATDYLRTLYVCALPLVIAPALDHALIGMGNTLVMSMMELCAVAMHYFLAPILIYGAEAGRLSDHPGAQLAGRVAGFLGIEGHGIAGAAWSAALSRAFSVSLGLYVMRRRHGVRLFDGFAHARRLGGRALFALEIARISLPMCLSIATYASVYW